MTEIKDDINLQQVRAIVEQIARKEKCCITQVEIKQVQTLLGKGNNGTVGAYLKQVKQEFINSKAFDRANISMQLKSVVMEEIDRFADNARDNANENLEMIERLNQELRELNIQAERTIVDLQQAILDLKTTTAEELRKTADDLLKNQQQLEASRESAVQLKTELESSRSDLKTSTEKVVDLAKLNGKLEAEVESAKKASSDLAAQSLQSNIAREKAERKAVNAEQASTLHQKSIGLLEEQKSGLERDLQAIKDNMGKLMARHQALQEKFDTTNQERINDLQKAVSGRQNVTENE